MRPCASVDALAGRRRITAAPRCGLLAVCRFQPRRQDWTDSCLSSVQTLFLCSFLHHWRKRLAKWDEEFQCKVMDRRFLFYHGVRQLRFMLSNHQRRLESSVHLLPPHPHTVAGLNVLIQSAAHGKRAILKLYSWDSNTSKQWNWPIIQLSYPRKMIGVAGCSSWTIADVSPVHGGKLEKLWPFNMSDMFLFPCLMVTFVSERTVSQTRWLWLRVERRFSCCVSGEFWFQFAGTCLHSRVYLLTCDWKSVQLMYDFTYYVGKVICS